MALNKSSLAKNLESVLNQDLPTDLNEVKKVKSTNKKKAKGIANALDKFVKSRHKIAKYYNSKLNELPLTLPWQSRGAYSSYHLYPILIKSSLSAKTQKQVYSELRKNDIAVNLHYIPVHRHPYYENLGFKKNDFPNAEKFHKEVISLPMHPYLSEEEVEYISDAINSFFDKT